MKLFKEYKLNIKKIIIFAVIAGIYTALMALIPIFEDTSFRDITISFEVWILFGIFIIMNSDTPKKSALYCFLFFLISQPLVYLIQVPFVGVGILSYYRNWIVWTILTIPMGFIGNYLKKDKWWGLFILVTVLLFLGYHNYDFVRKTIFMFPHHLLSVLFCIATIIMYPLVIFKNKKNRVICLIISILIVISSLGLSIYNKISYTTDLTTNGGKLGIIFDDTYKVYLKDSRLGEVKIVYNDGIEDYVITGKFNHGGKTNLVLEDASGKKETYKLEISYNKYDIFK